MPGTFQADASSHPGHFLTPRPVSQQAQLTWCEKCPKGPEPVCLSLLLTKAANVEVRKPSESDRPLCTSVDISSLLSKSLSGFVTSKFWEPKEPMKNMMSRRILSQHPRSSCRVQVQEITALQEGSLFSPNICLHN